MCGDDVMTGASLVQNVAFMTVEMYGASRRLLWRTHVSIAIVAEELITYPSDEDMRDTLRHN